MYGFSWICLCFAGREHGEWDQGCLQEEPAPTVMDGRRDEAGSQGQGLVMRSIALELIEFLVMMLIAFRVNRILGCETDSLWINRILDGSVFKGFYVFN